MNWEELVFEAGRFDGVFVLDVHGHIGAHKPFQLGDYDADHVAATAKRVGVDAVCVSSLPSIVSDWQWGNDEVAEACAKHPDVILGYAVPNPFYADCDIAPYLEMPGFRGIKVHGNMQGDLPLNDPRYFAAYELADKKGLPVLFHAWMPSEVKAAADVARRYPNAAIILGHSGMTARAEAVEAAKQYDNILIDTAISSTYDNAIEVLTDKVGADKVVYGSDMSFFDCIHTLGKIALAKLTDTEKEKILGLNAKELFGL